MATQAKSKVKDEDKVTAEEAPDSGKLLLELTTLAPTRPTVRIDDIDHEFRLMQEFGAVEHQEFTRDSRRYDALWSQDNTLNKSEKQQMVKLLDRLFDRVLVDAAKVREQLVGNDPITGKPRLTGTIKREIVVTFTNAPLLMAMAQQTDETDNEAGDSSTTES